MEFPVFYWGSLGDGAVSSPPKPPALVCAQDTRPPCQHKQTYDTIALHGNLYQKTSVLT